MLNYSIKKKEGDSLSRQANADFTERNKSVYKIVKVATVATHLITGILSVASLNRFLAADFGNFYLLMAVIGSVLIILELLQNAGLNAYFRNSLSPLHEAEDDYSNSLVQIGFFIAVAVTAINIILPTASGYFSVTGEKISIASKLQRIKTDSPSPTLDLTTVKSKYKGLAAANQASAQKAAAETQATIVAAVTKEHAEEALAANFAQNIAAFSLLFIAILMEFAKWGGTKLKWTYIFRAAAENNKKAPPLFDRFEEKKATAGTPTESTETRNTIGFRQFKPAEPVATEKNEDLEGLNIRLNYERGKQELRSEGLKLEDVLIDAKKKWELDLANWRNKLSKGIGKEHTNKEHIRRCEAKIQEIELHLNNLKQPSNDK